MTVIGFDQSARVLVQLEVMNLFLVDHTDDVITRSLQRVANEIDAVDCFLWV